MARRFPHAQVLGIDLAPIPLNPDQLTPNIRFEIDDINLGLAHYGGRFDLVHMRCVGGGSDYAQTINYAAQCVKPGGVLLLLDIDLQLCAEDKVSAQKMLTPNQPEGSWLQRYIHGT
jgi:SAM-dependent methyltransferase